ncbi:MAG: hypothetical protein QOJ97_2029 [Solirubrobacteraceae bacterium]|nr:hypothetical protein [Solirubrobacteraceae bacterium]
MAGGLLWLVGLCGVASADTFTVTRFDDPAPKTGVGTTPCVAADCSLREAVISANTTPGSTIEIPAGRVVLSIPGGGENEAVTGDLDLTANTTVKGAGAAATTVDGATLDRVFDMPYDVFEGCLTPDRKVSISGLTITGGRGEFNVGFGKLLGGGGIVVCGQLTLQNAGVTANQAVGAGGAMVVGPNSTAAIDKTTASANLQGGRGQPGGGGILVQGPDPGNFILGIPAQPGGSLTMTDSTVSGNTAGGGGGLAPGEGGGILNLGGTVSLTNVTLSDNTAGGAGAPGFGGGIFTLTGGTTTLLNTTIANNSAAENGSGGNLSTSNVPNGGGVADGTFVLKNTIVTGGAAMAAQGNCNGDGFTSQGGNLESANQCGLTGPGDQRNTDPQLGPLADNGGPTLTRAPQGASPALNAALNAGCPVADQRGTARPQVGTCDVGAVEVVWQTDLAVTIAAPPTLTLGEVLVYDVTVTNNGPQTAQGIALVNVLPAAADLLTATPMGMCGGAPFGCVIPDLVPGAAVRVAIRMRPRAAGTLTAAAAVAGIHADPNPANNGATATTAVAPPPFVPPPPLGSGLAGVPVTCRRADFIVHARAITSGRLRWLRVFLDGRRIASRSSKSYPVRIPAARLRPGVHRITVEALGSLGQRARSTTTFRRCPAPPARSRPRFTG